VLRQVSWLSGHRGLLAFPEKIQWHEKANRSPITVAGAASESKRSACYRIPFESLVCCAANSYT